MSIRSFVTVCSLLLLGWLALAFIHRPAPNGGSEALTAERPPEAGQPAEIDNLAVSVSP